MGEMVVEVAYRSTAPGGELIVNTMAAHVVWDTGLPTPEIDEIVDAIDAWLTEDYCQMLADDYSVDQLAVRQLDSETPWVRDRELNLTGTLGSVSGELPVECCLVLSWRSDLATRSGRGRIFVPSPLGSAALQAPDKWSTTAQYWIHAGTFADRYMTEQDVDYGTGGIDTFHLFPMVWSRVHQEGYTLTSWIRRSRPHWLRSRSTAP